MKYKKEGFVFYEYGTHAVLHKYLGSDKTAVIPAFSPQGTIKYVTDIEKSGLIAKSRLYVHLSPDYDTAVKVGSRHGCPVVFAVNAKQMYHDGYRFYKSANNVWLTKYVPPFYLTSG